MTDEQIIAYVDGELGPIEALRFERAVDGDPDLAARVDRHRRLRESIAAHFAPIADAPPPERLTALLGRAGNVVGLPGARKTGWRRFDARYAALAATLVAGLVIGQLLPQAMPGPIGQSGNLVVARGALARALDRQLASEAPSDAVYRIGVSFRGRDGRYCRAFEAAAGAGIGCHGAAGWELARFVAGVAHSPSAGYRQASSASVDILAAAQDMMTGAPLDAGQERRARAEGWAERQPSK